MESKTATGFYAVKELNTSKNVEDARLLVVTPATGAKQPGAVCPDHFTTMDSIVACKQFGAGIGGRIVEVNAHARTIAPLRLMGLMSGATPQIYSCIWG